jgi:hypothetical protein
MHLIVSHLIPLNRCCAFSFRILRRGFSCFLLVEDIKRRPTTFFRVSELLDCKTQFNGIKMELSEENELPSKQELRFHTLDYQILWPPHMKITFSIHKILSFSQTRPKPSQKLTKIYTQGNANEKTSTKLQNVVIVKVFHRCQFVEFLTFFIDLTRHTIELSAWEPFLSLNPDQHAIF